MPGPFTADDFAERTGATSEQMQALQRFHELLVIWNERLNLVGSATLDQFWGRHAYDSAQLLHVEQSARRWLDVGAGAGFPGLILGVLLKGQASACVHLVESMAKRVRFLEAVAGELDLPVQLHHARAEATDLPKGLEVITARACAPFPRLFDYTHHFFKDGARGLFLKGRDVESELTDAGRRWTFQSELIQSRSDPSGRLVSIKGLTLRGQ